MRFTINKTVLLRELDAALGAIEKKSTIPILSNIKISTEGDELVIQATDLDISITCRCMAQVKDKGEVCLPAIKLAAIIKSLNDGDVEFWQKEGKEVQIKSGRSKFNLSGNPTASYPVVESANVEFRTMPSGAFGDLMRRGRIAISTEESRYTLAGVKLEINGSLVRVVSSDGHRLALSDRTVSAFEGLTFGEILPKKAVAEVIRLSDLDTVVGLGFMPNQIYFQFGNRILSTRTLTGQFPNYSLILPKDQPKAQIQVPAAELLSLINRVAILADDRVKTITLELTEGQLNVSSLTSDSGNSFDSIPVEHNGESFKIHFNSTYLCEYLSAINGRDVIVELRSAETQVVLKLKTEDANEQSLCVVMPLRL